MSLLLLRKDVVLAVHEEQLATHGGAPGVRDPGLLDSALARPRNKIFYANTDAAALAASYAFGIARNHPFVDGNKRTAYVAMEVCLALNGFILGADDADALLTMLRVAAGELTEDALASWVRRHLVSS